MWRRRSLPKRIVNGSSWGTYFPKTTKQTVMGVARIKPTGPHSQVQNAAATNTPTGDTPVPLPNNNGSTMLAVGSSSNRNKPNASKGSVQPGNTASVKITRIVAASQVPT